LLTLSHALVAALTGPVLLLGSVFPGFGALPDGAPVPATVQSAVERADIAPETGGRVFFNNPHGPRSAQYALVRRLDEAVDEAVPGATLRLAAYSLAMPSTTRALLRAHDRGVHVRVVVDDHSAHWGAARQLREALGTSTGEESFLKVCQMSCRGGRGNQHAKFLTVTDSSRGEGLVLVGSLNLTNYSSRRQWNDLYSVVDLGVHDQLATAFDQMAADRPRGRLLLPVTAEGFSTDVSPYTGVSTRTDPLTRRLRAIRCRDAAVTAGRDGRTVVRIVMHAWNGERGILLARRVARLERNGCDVRVLLGVGTGRAVKRILLDGGVPVRDSEHRGRRVHHKVMILSGAIGSHTDAQYVWTGSHNWSDRSLRNDEVMVRVAGRALVDDYLANFRRIWRVARR
jgi:phosphatidylserine/phosphatidylglycerophosphate/cardiolipin synthase-like enzyme